MMECSPKGQKLEGEKGEIADFESCPGCSLLRRESIIKQILFKFLFVIKEIRNKDISDFFPR